MCMKIDVFNRPQQKVAVFVKEMFPTTEKIMAASSLPVCNKKIRRVPLPTQLILPSQRIIALNLTAPIVPAKLHLTIW